MPDLTIVVVVPVPLKGALDQIRAIATGVETVLRSAGCPMEIELEYLEIAVADGKLYEEDFSVYRERFQPHWMVDLAKVVVGEPRKKYVLFVSKKIHSVLGVVGFSVNGQAVTCVELPPAKQTVGKGDSHTWAHEICHGLGLNHKDGEVDNLMYPSCQTVDGVKAGGKLNSGQGVNLLSAAERLAKTGV